MTTDLILYGDASVPALLTTARAGAAANRAAASQVFSAYQQRGRRTRCAGSAPTWNIALSKG